MKTFLLLILFPLSILGQDMTGMWAGYLQVADTKLPYELAISGKGKDLNGYSLIVFTFDGAENIGVKTMELRMKRGRIDIEDGELIYDNYTTPGRRVKLYGSLAWVGKDLNLTLAGTFATRSLDMRAPNENSFKGTVFLQKKTLSAQTRLLARLEEMGLTEKLSFLKQQAGGPPKTVKAPERKNSQPWVADASVKRIDTVERKTQVIRRINFASDSIVINLYDNGEVDGDTISVFLNGKVILSKQGLTATAITKTIYANEIGDSSELVMYAENLGRIPPNSGLLVIRAGYERYQVRFTGDLENSSAVILKRRRL